MKLSRKQLIVALALIAGGAFAQTNNVSSDTDYASFSRFVTERNIFDPNREPHRTGTRTTRTRTTRTRSASAPAFSFVGTIDYEKGLFAFFSGNSDELKQALPVSGKIAGYTLTEVSRSQAILESADKKQKLELKVGDVVRQENGKWELSGQGDVTSGSTSPASTNSSRSRATESSSGDATSSDSNSNDSSVAAPSAALESNDTLKKLMEKRAKENQ